MKAIQLSIISLVFCTLNACHNTENNYDASGAFEAVETIISAEANGKIMAFNLSEGDVLSANQSIGYIDSTQLYLQKLQLEQHKIAVLSSRPEIKKQIRSLEEQLATAKANKTRIESLVQGGVATQKQLDDAQLTVSGIEAQITATYSSLNTQTASINEQAGTLDIQLREVEDRLQKCRIVNPISGTVLAKYAEPFEITAAGRPLYKIADLSTIILRAYITGNQLPLVQLGQKVQVLADGIATREGTIRWISDKSEFTPKSIHTKEERANLVYAVKIEVPNEGKYKIGMYGEVIF